MLDRSLKNAETSNQSSRPRSLWLIVAGCWILIGVGYWAGTHLLVIGSQPNSGLRIDSKRLNLGNVWAQEGFVVTLPILNETDKEQEIVQFRSSCNCASIRPESLSLPAGATRDIQVVIDLTPPPSEQPTEPMERFDVDIAAVVKGSTLPVSWRLGGNVRRPVILSSSIIQFAHDELNIAQAQYPAKEVSVRCAVGIESVYASCDAKFATVDLEPLANEPDQRGYRLRLTPSPELPIGPFRFDVEMNVTTTTGDKFRVGQLIVDGVVVDDLEFVPTTAHFGTSRIGENLEISVMLKSRTNKRFILKSIDTLPEGLQVNRLRENLESDVHLMAFRQEVLGIGHRSSVVAITIGSEEGTRTLLLPTTYHGLGTTDKDNVRESTNNQVGERSEN